MDKKELAERIIRTGGSLFLIFDPRKSSVPANLKNREICTFQYGQKLPIPIPDLFVNSDGISATLSFAGQPVSTFVPWSAVYSMHDDGFRGMSWGNGLVLGEASLRDMAKPPRKPALRLIQGGKA